MIPKSHLTTLLAPFLSLLFLLPAAADDTKSDPWVGVRSIHLKSGTVIEGRVLEITDTLVVFEFAGVPGSKGSVARSAMAPSDVFSLLYEERDPKTAEDWLGLAKEAEKLGLYGDRVWALRNAVKLDPKRAEGLDKEIEETRQVCSKERLDLAKSYRDAGELERAGRYLHSVLDEYCGCVIEPEANELLRTITENAENEKARVIAVKAERRKTQDSQESLQAIRDLMERGELSLREGRQSLERPGTSITRFSEAQALFERGWKLLGRFVTPSAISAESLSGISMEVGRLKESLRDDMVNVHLELGHAYLTRSNFNSATAHAGEAAALDPEDPGVLALRIAIAAGRTTAGGVR